MNGTESLLKLVGAFDRAEIPYIEKWCAEHGTMEVLAEAKAEAALAWEDDEAG
jgi:hypothetical protein